MAQKTGASKWRKTVLSGLGGGVVGLGAMLGLASLIESGRLGEIGDSEAIAAVVGMTYAVMALMLGVGLAGPGFGARFLNVEDAEELREMRRMLALAAASMGAMGATLIVLALAGGGGIVPPRPALAAAAVLFAASCLLAVMQWRLMDELMRNMSNESGNLAFYLLLLIGGGWAMLAHLGYATPPAPLDWLTMFFALVLLASFIAAARRGMLAPR